MTQRSSRLEADPWLRLRLLAVAAAVIVALGVAGYMLILGWTFVEALYMTLTTLTTVGFGEVRELDTTGRILTMTVLVMGVSLVAILIAQLAQLIQEGGLGERGRRRRMQKRVEDMKDHFVICAYGRVGRTVAREFEAEGVIFVVVDKDDELEDLMLRDGVTYLIEDPTRESALISAGIERARGVVSAVDDDAQNLYITLTAKALNPDLYIVARASEEATAQRLYTAGADRVISPYVSSGRHMALLALRPRVVDYLEVESEKAGGLRLEEMLVEEGSDLIGQPLSSVCDEGACLVLRREGGETYTNPDTQIRLAAGDLLVLLGEEKALRSVGGA